MSSQNRSDDQELVSKNLELIISSSNYQLAHEDRELLNSDEMRGVRMLLEINKPEKKVNDSGHERSGVSILSGDQLLSPIQTRQPRQSARRRCGTRGRL